MAASSTANLPESLPELADQHVGLFPAGTVPPYSISFQLTRL